MEKKGKIALSGMIAIAVLTIMLVVGPSLSAYDHDKTYNANATYFVEEHSTGVCWQDTVVSVMFNYTKVSCGGYEANITFDPNCVNITAADFTNSAWGMPIFEHNGDNVFIKVCKFAGVAPGDRLVANITVRCINATSHCTSSLNITNLVVADVPYGNLIPTTIHNGTIDCTPPPDLNVSKITVNPDYPALSDMAFGPTNHTGARTQCNNISAVIEEGNGVAVNNFDVLFRVTNKTTGAVVANCDQTGLSLAGGDNITVWCNCSWYPFAHEDYTINVTVDPQNAIMETDENNNTMLRDVTAHVHGLKGNHWQDGRNISKMYCDSGNINLLYSVGDSSKKGASDLFNAGGIYLANWTTGDLPIPDTATIQKARLYVYYNWDKTTDRNVTDYFSLKFNTNTVNPDKVYTDCKAPDLPHCGYGCADPIRKYAYGYGMVAYNVTGNFVKGTTNTANLTLDPFVWQNKKTAITGMLLVVVYEDSSEPMRIICINEGFDMLLAGPYWGYDYGTTSEEATTYANFTGENIPVTFVTNAKLVTITNHAQDGGDDRLYFNGQLLGNEPWTNMGATEICNNETTVTNLMANNNTATFQSLGDFFEATNAFLVVEMVPVLIGVEPKDTIVQPQDQFDINITIDTGGVPVFGVEYYLHYNTSVVRAETQNKGPFLGNYSDTIVVINDIDQANGIVSYAETRKGDTGKAGIGTLSTIQFTAIGERGAMSHLNLTGVIIVKEDKNETSYIVENGTVTINNNRPPVPIPTSKHRVNNVAKKYPCITKLCACKSYDPDEGKGGNISYVRWDFGDGQYGTSEGEFIENCTGAECEGCQKDHKYESWKWEPFGDPEGHYVPFTAMLTLTDDGCPEETNSSFLDVTVYIAGDANGDGRVNILDAVYVGRHWNERCDAGTWPPERCGYYWTDDRVQQDKADLNNDCVINILDAVIIGANWGHVAW